MYSISFQQGWREENVDFCRQKADMVTLHNPTMHLPLLDKPVFEVKLIDFVYLVNNYMHQVRLRGYDPTSSYIELPISGLQIDWPSIVLREHIRVDNRDLKA